MQKTVTQNTTIIREKSSSNVSLKKGGELNQIDLSSENMKENVQKRSLSPIATQRTIIINRTNSQPSHTIINKSFAYDSMLSPINSNVSGEIGNFKRDREKDKKDMRNLNEKLAGYIEQVRFLEAQNKKQGEELTNLKEKWGKETEEVKNMYSNELKNLQILLIDAEKNRGKMDFDLNNLQNDLQRAKEELDISRNFENELRKQLEKCEEELSEEEALISMLKKRIANLDEQKLRDRKEILNLRDEIQNLQTDLNNQTIKYLNSECELQGKLDEIEFLKQIHQAQLNELSALAYRDTTKDNKDFWKAEIALAMQDIQSDYDDRIQMLRSSIESQNGVKMQDIKSENAKFYMELNATKEENKRIKNDWNSSKSKMPDLENKIIVLERTLVDVRQELEENKRDYEMEISNKTKELADADFLIQDIQMKLKTLLDDKLSLQLEIAAYRKLLEGEETRWTEKNNTVVVHENGSLNNSLKTFINQIQEESIVKKKIQETNTMSTGEISAKSTFNRTTKGNCSILECSTDGKCITLENIGKLKEDMSDMTINRDIDHGRQLTKFMLPKKTILDPSKTLKIWAKGFKPSGTNDLEILETNWGIGSDIHTTLLSATGEEKATYTQKTITIKK
uniref:Intermediate filament protein n=1 Tax=Dugesia japonica TaxID=6161 RepID=Q86M45_DUGJA|nr:intermediate filament protein [Dugesia japonica]